MQETGPSPDRRSGHRVRNGGPAGAPLCSGAVPRVLGVNRTGTVGRSPSTPCVPENRLDRSVVAVQSDGSVSKPRSPAIGKHLP
ncbi:hypothetical protein SKAU_G00001420 [Synaphobranchus kaupii]|uniref:Uncharacterized protein n=1 Tax=Synaphobranchus kaupii TaxID=118154 RepID=A0A9Q1JCJ8_SYNKA|nr:hypothetical protein SKAU_G00001420 [Synaphobranchus kaupii]